MFLFFLQIPPQKRRKSAENGVFINYCILINNNCFKCTKQVIIDGIVSAGTGCNPIHAYLGVSLIDYNGTYF